MSIIEMPASSVLVGTGCQMLRGATGDLPVSALEFSSGKAGRGSLFFCVRGTQADGHAFAADALGHGASGLVVDHELELDAPQYVVEDVRAALSACSANFYGHPSEKLALVGITGTNGKTTTSFLVEHVARCAGQVTGLMGTVECRIAGKVEPSVHTTPESRDLQELLARMVDAGVDTAALEVSSHAIDLGRIADARFAVAAFTNLSQDHLDYHKTMENYFLTKARLFTEAQVGTRVVCIDGDYGKRLAGMVEQKGLDMLTVGVGEDAQLRVVQAEYAPHSTRLELDVCGEAVGMTLPLVGRFNVENALVAFGVGLSLGFGAQDIARALGSAPQVPGRLERVTGASGTPAPFGVLVDYAHTPDSVGKAISAVRAVTPGRVICVFGCGGDRDADKRPKMGRAACAADIAVVTSDNPRTEDPKAIIADILPGMDCGQGRTHVIEDRREAIRFAVGLAQEGDCVLIAGKGHEDYQIVGTERRPFDDRVVAAEELDAL